MGYHKVVVIGGRYAETLAVNRLRMCDDVGITLVNPRPEFVERIRLHQFVPVPATPRLTTARCSGRAST